MLSIDIDFLLLFTSFFSLKNDHLYNFFYSEVRFSRQCSMYSWVKLYLVIIPTSWNKKTEQVCLSDPVYMEKSCLGQVEGSPIWPSYLGRAKFKNIFGKMLAQLEGSPFCDATVILLATPTFLHLNTLVHPAMETRSRRDNQSVHNAVSSSKQMIPTYLPLGVNHYQMT